MTVRQQRLGAKKQLDGDQRRPSRRVTCGLAQPSDRLLVTPFRSEHQMIGHVQLICAGRHQRDRGLTMQQAAGRRRHVLIDRIVHELVPEHDSIVSLVEELSFERVAELPNDLGRRAAGDRGDVTKRRGIAQHRRDLQQLQRGRRQVAQAANHKVAERGRQLEGRWLDVVPDAAQHSSIDQRAQHGHGPQRVPASLGQHGGQGRTGRGSEHVSREDGHLVVLQRLEAQGARASGRQIVEQPDDLGRQWRRPGCHHDEQRRKRQLPRHRQDRRQAGAVRPVDVFGHQQGWAFGGQSLHQVHDLLDHPVLDIAGGPRRCPRALPGQQPADRSLARVR